MQLAVAYVAVGLVLAVIGGTIIGALRLEDQVADFILQSQVQLNEEAVAEAELTKAQRWAYARAQVRDIVSRVWPYILVGVGIGAGIHNWIPVEWIQKVLGSGNPFSVILATLVGVPMYADILALFRWQKRYLPRESGPELSWPL